MSSTSSRSSSSSRDIYCGNNGMNRDLVEGRKVLGTRHTCLKKGIGKGMSLPLDNDYTGEYRPIDTRKFYCGDRENLPEGYEYMGSLSQCLQKGVGIGKGIRARGGRGGRGGREGREIPPPRPLQPPSQSSLNTPLLPRRNTPSRPNIYITILAFLLISGGLFTLLYFLKPGFLTREKVGEEGKKEREIDVQKFLAFYFPLVAVVALIAFPGQEWIQTILLD